MSEELETLRAKVIKEARDKHLANTALAHLEHNMAYEGGVQLDEILKLPQEVPEIVKKKDRGAAEALGVYGQALMRSEAEQVQEFLAQHGHPPHMDPGDILDHHNARDKSKWLSGPVSRKF